MSDWRAIVEEIRRDNRSGATALLGRAADALTLAAATASLTELADAARSVAAVRPAMGALCRLASVALAAAEDASSARAAGPAVRRFMRRVEGQAPAIAERAAGLIRPGDVALTISASSLVERALRAATPRRVICLESRPANEGVALATRLSAAGLDVTLVSDAAGPSAAAQADLVLLGGDTLSPSGLIHKIGTLGLALAARHHGVPVYALCGREKRLPAPLRGALADGGPPEELLADAPPGLAVTNPYFDLTSLDLIKGVVGPTAILPGADAGRRARRVAVHPSLGDLLDRRS